MTPAYVITGPTASGKTEVALRVAEKLGAGILAMDSATVYRGMDIGTAKPSAADRARVPHHLLDIADSATTFSVADWLRAAKTAEAATPRPIYVGGTPLYLKALLHGLFDAPPQDPAVRRRLEALPDLHAELAKVDPASAKRLHPNDRKRLIRALEVHAVTGRPLSDQLGQWDTPPRPARIVWLDPPRERLRERIDRRARAMLAGGLVEEARRLTFSEETRKFIGYAEALAVGAGTMTVEDAAKTMVARTWTLVRRQTTWLRGIGTNALRLAGTDVDALVAETEKFFSDALKPR